MLSIGGTTRVFLAVQPVDFRGSFDRLYGYVSQVLREDPRSGHWFCFTNKRRHQTTFSIPIRYRVDCIPVASTAWATFTRGSAQGPRTSGAG